MRYIKLFISSIVALLIAAVVIWSSLLIVLFSALATPFIAWWIARKADINVVSVKTTETTSVNPDSYKVIEAEYEIIEK